MRLINGPGVFDCLTFTVYNYNSRSAESYNLQKYAPLTQKACDGSGGPQTRVHQNLNQVLLRPISAHRGTRCVPYKVSEQMLGPVQ